MHDASGYNDVHYQINAVISEVLLQKIECRVLDCTTHLMIIFENCPSAYNEVF